MKKSILTMAVALLGVQLSFAVPDLQLDISPGTYDPVLEDTVADSDAFQLQALIKPDTFAPGTVFYVSIAVIPSISPEPSSPPDLGTISYDGTTYDVTGDFEYGNPPIAAVTPPGSNELPGHGIFDTYYIEVALDFNTAFAVPAYDAQTGDPVGSEPFLWLVEVDVDISNLDPDYEIHFDLYTKDGENLDVFAPFSHDASTGGHDVPEGGTTLVLLGLALVGLRGIGKRAQLV